MKAIPTDPESPDVEIVAVGAHLSGMPLNNQLTELGARFARNAHTNANYRLYSLPGQSIPKPGLIRVLENEGAEIEVEVWRLTPEAFGNFIATIPAPLCIGTVILSDGTTAKGFLVESVGLHGAEDISVYGGWRSFMEHVRLTG